MPHLPEGWHHSFNDRNYSILGKHNIQFYQTAVKIGHKTYFKRVLWCSKLDLFFSKNKFTTCTHLSTEQTKTEYSNL